MLSFMIKSLLCAAGVVACGVAFAPSAQADGFYINPEWNGAWSDADKARWDTLDKADLDRLGIDVGV